MDYEKKYNDALNQAKFYHGNCPSEPERKKLEKMFPELKESEDEKIRKALMEFLREAYSRGNAPEECAKWLVWLDRQKERESIIQDVELNDAVYDYVRDHFIAGADFTPEYIKKLMENAFFAGVDYYLLKQESESCEPDTNVEKVIEDVIRVYGKTQGEWVGGYDVDTLIVNLRRAFNKKEQKPINDSTREKIISRATSEKQVVLISESNGKAEIGWDTRSLEDAKKLLEYGLAFINENGIKPAEWSEEDENKLLRVIEIFLADKTIAMQENPHCKVLHRAYDELIDWLKSLRPQPHWKPSEEQIYSLGTVVNGYDNCTVGSVGYNLKELYEQLKKLM